MLARIARTVPMIQALTHYSSRYARLLAVVAVLCVTGLQFQEASHEHGADDGVSHCLVCKSSADSPIAVAAATEFAIGHRPIWLAVIPASVALQPLLSFNPRGPPAIS